MFYKLTAKRADSDQVTTWYINDNPPRLETLRKFVRQQRYKTGVIHDYSTIAVVEVTIDEALSQPEIYNICFF